MNLVNIIRALTAVGAILAEAQQAIASYSALVERARAEGRDITDAELDQLHAQREAALQSLRARIGA